MKRSPLVRRTPLRSKTPLKSKTPLRRSSGLKTARKRRKLVPLNNLRKYAQAEVNRYCRLRDCGLEGGANCISCHRWYEYDRLEGGHFIPQTASSPVRYDERNINAQCVRCNHELQGNQRHYYHSMVKKYGQEVVDYLESMEGKLKKWSREELEEIRATYKQKCMKYNH